VAVNVRGRSYKILADVEIAIPTAPVSSSPTGFVSGGHTLFIKDKKLHYVYNFLGIKPEQKFSSDELKPGKYTFGMEFIRDKAGEHGESLGKTNLYVNDRSSRKATSSRSPANSRCQVTGSASGATAAMQSARNTRHQVRSRAARSNSLASRSRKRSISTSRSSRMPRWRSIDLVK